MRPVMITKVQQLERLRQIVLIKNRTPEFVAEIQGMTDNNSSKSTRSVTKDVGVSEFLLKLVAHEDIRYFSWKMRKG